MELTSLAKYVNFVSKVVNLLLGIKKQAGHITCPAALSDC